jgi:hypothetical protein
MSTLVLNSYASLQSNIFIKIECPYYKTSPSATPIEYDFLFSDRIVPYTLSGDSYVGLGKLLSIGSTTSELRVSANEVTIAISGIPNTSIAEIVNSRIKGSKVTITRVLFDHTGTILSVTGNPLTKFIGFVNNLALEEEYDVENRQSSNTLLLACNSIVDVLENKIAGRKTNPASMKSFYSTDVSMDRIPTLENSSFDFGVKK